MGCGGSKSTGTQSQGPPGGGARGGGPVLYLWAGSAPCRAVLLTVKAAGVTVDVKHVDLLKGESTSEEFLKINPEHTLPTLVDGDFTLWESRAIMQYLVNQYAPGHAVYPAGLQQKANVDRFLNIDLSLVYGTVSKWIYPQLFAGQEPDAEKEADFNKAFDFLNEHLSDRKYVTGDTATIADFTICCNISLLEHKDYDVTKWPNLKDYLARMRELPYYAEVNQGLEDWKAGKL